jgi:sec-independent protein translocase protein TatB
MLDMSWGELMLIGGVALVVIPPKDLPKALRTLGQMTTKVRRMAGEFQSQFSEAMRQADLDDVRKDLEALNRSVTSSTSTAFNPIETIRNELKNSIEAPNIATTTMSTPAISTEIVPSSPELAIATDLAEDAASHAASELAGPAEEIGAPPAIVPISSAEPVHVPAPIEPMELTGPGLEPAPIPKAAEIGSREGERA